MRLFTSYLAFIICVVGTLATGYGMITHGLKHETTQAYMCSCSCALFIWSLFNSYELIQRAKELNDEDDD